MDRRFPNLHRVHAPNTRIVRAQQRDRLQNHESLFFRGCIDPNRRLCRLVADNHLMGSANTQVRAVLMP